MKTIPFKAADRGHFDFGWLNTHHTFSFGQYYDPAKMHFGRLRVFNDDIVEPGAGFGTHPHDNMEIISIPLQGTIVHRDSTGTEQALTPGEVQVMSAGSGITHSEYNGSDADELHFLQIWIYPNERDVEPRYDQQQIELNENTVTPVVGPPDGEAPLWMHQHAWLDMAVLSAGSSVALEPHHKDHGIFIFSIHGDLKAADVHLSARDSVGIVEASSVELQAVTDCKTVIIHVPMT